MNDLKPLSLYLHVPFCARHCAYCDFNVYVDRVQSGLVEQTVEATLTDIRRSASSLRETYRIETIFFGGGTPTYLSGEALASLLQTIRDEFEVTPDCEISSEANPGSSDYDKFEAMRKAGFNRLSVGVQAFDNGLLKNLDRHHSVDEAKQALRTARAAGFENLSLDLMFGLPGQTLSHWKETLETALSFETEHLSLYALTLEPGTRFERLHRGGKLILPEEDDELEMYESAISTLATAGYERYEVSNFAKPGFRARHNLTYWRNGEYLGVGPGAVSYLDGARFKREKLPAKYISKIKTGADLYIESESLKPLETLGETIMLGLRLREGISLSALEARFKTDPLQLYSAQIKDLEVRGLLEKTDDFIRLTHQGLLLANIALGEFLLD